MTDADESQREEAHGTISLFFDTDACRQRGAATTVFAMIANGVQSAVALKRRKS